MNRLTLFSLMGALFLSAGTVMAQGNEVDQRIEKFCAEQKLYNEHVCTGTAAGLTLLEERDRFDTVFKPKSSADSAGGNNANSDGAANSGNAGGSSASWSDESGGASSVGDDGSTIGEFGMQ